MSAQKHRVKNKIMLLWSYTDDLALAVRQRNLLS